MSAYRNHPQNNPGQKQDQSPQPGKPEEQPIRVDGFNQVLEMLQIADPEFRESLLRRIAIRDRTLANQLRADLGI